MGSRGGETRQTSRAGPVGVASGLGLRAGVHAAFRRRCVVAGVLVCGMLDAWQDLMLFVVFMFSRKIGVGHEFTHRYYFFHFRLSRGAVYLAPLYLRAVDLRFQQRRCCRSLAPSLTCPPRLIPRQHKCAPTHTSVPGKRTS